MVDYKVMKSVIDYIKESKNFRSLFQANKKYDNTEIKGHKIAKSNEDLCEGAFYKYYNKNVEKYYIGEVGSVYNKEKDIVAKWHINGIKNENIINTEITGIIGEDYCVIKNVEFMKLSNEEIQLMLEISEYMHSHNNGKFDNGVVKYGKFIPQN